MLQKDDLNFNFPPELIATKAAPRGESRIMHISRDKKNFKEINWTQFLAHFHDGDTLVLNDSKVVKARLPVEKISGDLGEIFYLKSSGLRWQILSKGLNLKIGKEIDLPGGIKAKVLKADRISEIEILGSIGDVNAYLEKYGQVPLPPYIVQSREQTAGEDNITESYDRERYQNIWAKKLGSVAAPTAGLHFNDYHLKQIQSQGVRVEYVTLHVGAGTFLPIETENLKDFKIHSEYVEVGPKVCESIMQSQARGKKIWACGTTSLRAIETAVQAAPRRSTVSLIAPFTGETNLFVTPGYRFLAVNGLLTNFHQPQSSLLALAAAFATEQTARSESDEKKAVSKILEAYQWAIEKKFRLFSYGDLTVMS